MKKLITFLVAIIYLGNSISATVHMHYCMGKLASWSLYSGSADYCGKCSMHYSLMKGKHCCTDEQKTFKTTGDQKAAEVLFLLNEYAVTGLISAFSCIPDRFFSVVIDGNPIPNGPPLKGNIPIFIRNCVFRI